MLQRYGSLTGKLHIVELEKVPSAHSLGISLAGNQDSLRARMSVYVAGVDPRGPAGLDGRIQVGDELLEVRSWGLWVWWLGGKMTDRQITLSVPSGGSARKTNINVMWWKCIYITLFIQASVVHNDKMQELNKQWTSGYCCHRQQVQRTFLTLLKAQS